MHFLFQKNLENAFNPLHKFHNSMRRKIPSTQALACFEAAARHESYTRAAQELALTQSAVSRQVTALEDFLGVALFRRTRHGVALTPSGANYCARCRAACKAWSATRWT